MNKTNVHSFGAKKHTDGVTSDGDCLNFCKMTTTCLAVDINYNYRPVGCWVHTDQSQLSYTKQLYNVVQYRVISRICHDIDSMLTVCLSVCLSVIHVGYTHCKIGYPV